MGLLKWLRRSRGETAAGPLTTVESGLQAEEYVARHLAARGARIVARNLKDERGELDLIVEWPGSPATTAVIEIRSLRTRPGHHLRESLPPGKQEQVIQAARGLLPRQAWYRRGCLLRFDVAFVALDQQGKPVRLEYIPNAFGSPRSDWF